MTKKIFFLTVVGITLLLCVIACKQPNNSSTILVTSSSASKQFKATQYYADDTARSITLTANLIGSTEHLDIYLRDNQRMSDTNIDYIEKNFELQYDKLIEIYGTHTDVDDNGKIIILLYDMNATFTPSSGYIAGYFYSLDLYEGSGNNAEILYVESKIFNGIESLFGTVIHEFQHLINHNMNSIEGKGHSDLWLNEALSESTRVLVSEGMSLGRYNAYNRSSHDSIAKGNYFYHWGGPDVLADYSTAALFMYWLYLNGGGETVLQNIAKSSTDARGGYESILEAVGKTTSTLSSLDTWETVLVTWLEANENYKTGYPDGKHIFNGKTGPLELTSKVYSGSSASLNLFPGDAVLTMVTTTGNESNANIDRSNFKSDSETVHITLNKDTNINTGISIDVPATAVRNTARMNVFPVFIEEEYRIRHVPPEVFMGDN